MPYPHAKKMPTIPRAIGAIKDIAPKMLSDIVASEALIAVANPLSITLLIKLDDIIQVYPFLDYLH
jgi:hypothetical protein